MKELTTRQLLRGTTHLLDESFTTVVGDQRHEDLRRDLDWLRARGISVAVVFHGSDIRSPRAHLEREPHSYFSLMPAETVASLEKSTEARRRLAVESGLPLFVSTPDLLLDLPEATWLPLVIDVDAWHSTRPVFSGSTLRVLHVPSRRVPPIKGTSHIDPVLTRLAQLGEVEYISPESVPHGQMPTLVGSVDIVIDQLFFGSYGVAAVESMAAGRLTIGAVSRAVRDQVGDDLPIVDCAPEELEDLLHAIASDPAPYARIAGHGPAFAAKHHRGADSAAALHGWLSATQADPVGLPDCPVG